MTGLGGLDKVYYDLANGVTRQEHWTDKYNVVVYDGARICLKSHYLTRGNLVSRM